MRTSASYVASTETISSASVRSRAASSSRSRVLTGGRGDAKPSTRKPAEEKTSFALKLESFDAAQKIKVIKEVRAITDLGLKEAKELVEGAPAVLKKELKKEEAEALIAKLTAVGAVAALE